MSLTIAGKEYPVQGAELFVELSPDDRTATFSLYAESEKDTTGVTVNAQVIEGVASVDALSGTVFKAQPHPEDEIPSITDSSVYEQGRTYDLKTLTIRFGTVQGGAIQIELNAVAFELNEETFEQTGGDRPVSLSCQAKLCLEQSE